jgi:parvulin-like peptidyl-prolyl isomerase
MFLVQIVGAPRGESIPCLIIVQCAEHSRTVVIHLTANDHRERRGKTWRSPMQWSSFNNHESSRKRDVMQRLKRYTMKFVIVLFFQLIVALSSEAQESIPQDIVARIDSGYSISFPQLLKQVNDYNYMLMYKITKAGAFTRALHDMLLDRLKVIDFFDRGLNSNEEGLKQIRRSINEELVIQYFNSEFLHKLVSDKAVRKAYEEMKKEVVYQQIVLNKPIPATSKEVSYLESVARDIKAKIDRGEDFTMLVKQYSQDTESLRTNGVMPPINWKASLSNVMSSDVFHLALGEVQILEDGRSFYIVKVIRINRNNVKPFDEVKDGIRKSLEERFQDLGVQKFDKAKRALLDEKRLTWYNKGLRQVIQWARLPHFSQAEYADTLRKALSQGNNFLILRYPQGTVDLKEYLRLYEEVLAFNAPRSLREGDLKKYILEAVRTNILVNKAKKLGLEKVVFNQKTENPAIRNQIVRMYDREVIDGQIPVPTEEALEKFYQANKDSLFYQLAKVNIYAIVDSNKAYIDELKHKLDQNTPFEKLAPELLVKTFIRKRDGVIASYLSTEPPFLGAAALKLKASEIAGPIEYTDPGKGNMYALIKCIAAQEEKQLTYKDVEKTIAGNFREYHRARIAKLVQEQLMKNHSVTIYDDVLKKDLSLIRINGQ